MRSHSLLFFTSSLAVGPSRRLAKRFLLPILSILILFCPSLAGVASAGVNTWTTNGPERGDIRALAIDPTNPATLYAGTLGGGVFKSSNGGTSWSAINNGLDTSFVVSALVIDPTTPATVYAGTGNGLVSGGDAGGVFKSTNGGESWTATNAGLTSTAVFALAIDPSVPATLYASTYSGGVFKSSNGGGSWSAINTGLTTEYLLIVSSLVIDPSAPATLYAGTGYNVEFGPGDGVFKSTNGGETWSEINAGLTNPSVLALVIDPTNPATLYAGTVAGFFPGPLGGVFKSTNAGGNWSAINTGLTSTDVSALAIDRSNPATLYAGTSGGGVFKSSDGGGSWTAMNHGLTDTTVSALAIDPANPAKLYAGTGAGVFDYQNVVGPCAPGSTTLCLNGGRFQVQTQWTTRDGSTGPGQARAVTGDAGYFTFFDPANIEVMVKVLNGCSFNGNFWTYAGGLTDVNVVMTVTDSQTGDVKTYTNSQGTPFQPIQDTSAFETCAAGATGGARPYDGSAAGSLIPPSVVESFDEQAMEPCVPNSTTLCLSNSRYQVRAQWVARDGASGAGQVLNLTGDTGAFWFFSLSNVEMVIKVLNGCGLNRRYWTFAGGLTDVNVILTVTDTETGTVKTYTNPQGTPFQPIQDTSAFATCP